MQKSSKPAGGPTLKMLPAVSRLLTLPGMAKLAREYGSGLTTGLVRELLGELRERVRGEAISAGELARRLSPAAVVREVRRRAEAELLPRPRRVINASGVVVHTNLGRSLLCDAAAARVAESSRGYVDLEYDLDSGRRGSRLAQLEPLMSRLFPGHGFLAVNNNAAAIMLSLRALSRNKEVVVSRGELVEIGGSFRVPDILAASGARLSEVGTTNRTRLADYKKAIGKKTGAVLKVHTSNFRVVGFTEETPIDKLAGLCRGHDLPLIVDWGSGDLVDLEPLQIRDEIPIGKILEAGADLVTFSGDKLLGGPQAGIVVGRPELVERLRKDPLARVCRLDRLLIAALHETLAAYVRGRAFEEIPTLNMLARTPEEIGRRAEKLRRVVARRTGQGRLLEIVDGVSRTGGGSSPIGERPTRLLRVSCPGGDAGEMEAGLRAGTPPVVARIQDGKLLIDLRTVRPDQDEMIADRLAGALAEEMLRQHASLAAGRARKATGRAAAKPRRQKKKSGRSRR